MERKKHFGRLLRRRIAESELTIGAVAKKVSLVSLRKILKGERYPPDREDVLKIAKILRLDEEATDELLIAAGYFSISDPRLVAMRKEDEAKFYGCVAREAAIPFMRDYFK